MVTLQASAMPEGKKTEDGTVWAASAGQAVVDDEDTAKLRLTVPPDPVARGIALQMPKELRPSHSSRYCSPVSRSNSMARRRFRFAAGR